MIRSICISLGTIGLVVGALGARAQVVPAVSAQESDDNPRGNVHVGFPMAIPLNPTARAVHLGFGINLGGGYNFNRNHGLVGELLWNNLFPTNEALAKIRTSLGDPNVQANVGVTEVSGNYRFELRGKNLGTYFLGGAGLLYRHTSFTKEVVTGRSIDCTPAWMWWGFECTKGFVTEGQTIGSWSATAPGFNGGFGVTFRVGEPPYRFYTESRYHYAPDSRINMQFVEIAFGIRY